MVFTRMYHLVASSFLVSLVSLTVLNFLPDTLFGDFPLNPQSRTPIEFPSKIEGWNTLLSDKADYIQLNNLIGAESIAITSRGLLYSGLADGRIIEIDTNSKNYKMRDVTRMTSAKLCEKVFNTAEFMPECGRPLQLRLINDTLYVIDAYKGLYSINPRTGAKKHLMANLNKKFSGLFNSFVMDPKEQDIVYVTLSSRKWALDKIVWSNFDLEDSGIVFAYDLSTGKSVVIADKLILANGISADTKRDQLLFSESSAYRVHKMSLSAARSAFKSAKDGETKLVSTAPLIPMTQGLPDNIYVHGDEAYIALPLVKSSGKDIMDHLAEMPSVRKALGRFIYSTGKLLEYVQKNFWTHPMLDSAIFELKSGHVTYRTFKQQSAILVYNLATGTSKLLGSDKFGFISEAVPDDKGNLYLASFRNTFIVKVKV